MQSRTVTYLQRSSCLRGASSEEDSSSDEASRTQRRERRDRRSRRHKRRRLCPPAPRSIFQWAIDASSLTWDDPHLRTILCGGVPLPPSSWGGHAVAGPSSSGSSKRTEGESFQSSCYGNRVYPPSKPDYPSSKPDYPHSKPDYPPSKPDYPHSKPDYPHSKPDYPPSKLDYPPSKSDYPHSKCDYPPNIDHMTQSSKKDCALHEVLGPPEKQGPKEALPSSSGDYTPSGGANPHHSDGGKGNFSAPGPSSSSRKVSSPTRSSPPLTASPKSKSHHKGKGKKSSTSPHHLPPAGGSYAPQEGGCPGPTGGPSKGGYVSPFSPLPLPDFPTSTHVNELGQALWTGGWWSWGIIKCPRPPPPEPLPVACSRVEALRSHGFAEAALRLAVAVARTLKHTQQQAYHWWTSGNRDAVIGRWQLPVDQQGTTQYQWYQPWLGHPLDPINSLYDCLAEASLVPDDLVRYQQHSDWLASPTEEATALGPLRFRHRAVPDSCDPNESYLTLALEVALLGLGQHRVMPLGLYSQEKGLKHEERLLLKVQELTMDTRLMGVMKQQVCGGDGGHEAADDVLRLRAALDSALRNIHSSAHLFKLAQDAFRIATPQDGVRNTLLLNAALELGLQVGPPAGVVGPTALGWMPPSCSIEASFSLSLMNTVLLKPCAITCCNVCGFCTLIYAVDSSKEVEVVCEAAFFPESVLGGSRQVLRLTLSCVTWRRREMVRWLVTCATEVGVAALMSIMQGWYSLLTPPEAVAGLATTVMQHSTVMRLALDRQQQDELAGVARTLALQCAAKDPPSCALNALTLCEGEPSSFEAAYQVVVDAASTSMTSSQLFSIARYMEHRNHPHRAYTLALLAMQSVHISYTQDTHPAIPDIHWAVSLAHSLGRTQLTQLLPVFVKNVQCATVLSDVLRRCSLTPPGSLSGSTGASATPTAGVTPGMHGNVIHAVAAVIHDGKRRPIKALSFDKPPLRGLLDATILSYINTTNSRLTHISPRHYQDFIDFLTKAHETFMLAPDGHIQFAQLIENMKVAYKGKKKLMSLVRERFG
ncbi:hypothetical protein FHG87_019593 [Trinorchestia longiramus]|nr:hypothetical protein FHG87_019593 [Trinorchestia longiramus]